VKWNQFSIDSSTVLRLPIKGGIPLPGVPAVIKFRLFLGKHQHQRKPKMSVHRYFVPAFLLLWAASSLGQDSNASNDTTPVFRSKAALVVVDVVVTDARDQPVSGLVKKDFEILEDGQPQTVSFFEEHKAPSRGVAKLPPMPPHVYTNFPLVQTSDAVNVFLLDWLNTRPPDQAYVRAQVVKYIGQMPPGTRVAIFVLGEQLRLVQGVTADSAQLVAAFESDKARTAPVVSRLTPTTADPMGTFFFNPQKPQEALSMEQSVAGQVTASIATSRVESTLQALQQLARYLAVIPGRKNVLWFSGSFPVTLFPTTDTKTMQTMYPYQRVLQQTSDLLTPGQVAIYPIAAQALVGLTLYEADRPRPPSAKEQETADLARGANQIAMEELARDTGGRAYYNTNALSDAMKHVINDGERYYTLGYTPTNQKLDGTFRKIQVKISGNDQRASYRQGYYADEVPNAPAKQSASDALLRLMLHGLPDFTQLLYKVKIMPSSPRPAKDAAIAGRNLKVKRPVVRYELDFAVAVHDLTLQQTPDGVRHGDIEVALVAYGQDGVPVNSVIGEQAISLSPKAYAEAEGIGLQFRMDIDVPRGDIYLSTGIYDAASRRAGTMSVSLNDFN
jgi:VWFA-related protein